MSISIELHLFTNCTRLAPSTTTLRRTYKSFCETFGKIRPIIWCDPKPAIRKYSEYRKNIQNKFDTVFESCSLSDAYIKAIKKSKADYLFMLEHDWLFKKGNIRHTLAEILDAMRVLNIYHLRFNKRTNKIKGWDKILEPILYKDLNLCRTNILSNNPHIIERVRYLSFIQGGFIKVLPGSLGIEEVISKHPKTWGTIYGPLDWPATVSHIDGRRKRGRK
jgi:hypothetical protein